MGRGSRTFRKLRQRRARKRPSVAEMQLQLLAGKPVTVGQPDYGRLGIDDPEGRN